MARRTIKDRATSADPVTRYALLVKSGVYVAGPHVRAACKRHLRDLRRPKKDGVWFDPEQAQWAIDFFPEVLRLSEGQFEGTEFHLHPSQEFIVGSIFGWRRSSDGSRRFRRAYIEMGKGNGKSPLAGGIGLYGLVADGEPGAQIYAAAAKMDQARILFNDAVSMVRQSPHLERNITPSGVNPVNNLAHLASGSFFKPLGRDTGKTGSGLRPHFVLLDELHEHPNRDTLELLERGFKFRRQPLMCMITNSGSDRNSVCWEEHSHAVKVAHGEVEDDTTFAYVCALDEGEDPLNDPKCWVKANPMVGVILTEQYLADVASQARAMPGRANYIKRLHFCIWTDAESAWIARETWEKCEDADMSLDDFEGEECWMGLDLGATKDFTAKSYVFEDGELEDGRKKYALFCHAYTPRETLLERERSDKAPYSVWVEQGFVSATAGPVVRLDHVARDIVDDSARFVIMGLAYDRWLFRDFERDLDELNVTLPLMEHPQGIAMRKDSHLWMPGSINSFEDLLLEGRLRIQVNYFLRSCVSSATFWESPAGLRRFEKSKATSRIDGAVSSAMAIGAATAIETPRKQSYMATRNAVMI